jgi:hypothetical protein
MRILASPRIRFPKDKDLRAYAASSRGARRHARRKARLTLRSMQPNHFSIQNYYLTEIVKDEKGRPIMANRGVITKDHHDAYYKECKMPAAD